MSTNIGNKARAFVVGVALYMGCGDTYNITTGQGSGPNGQVTCLDACENMTYVCKDRSEDRMDSCLLDCETEPWGQEDVACFATHCKDDHVCNY